MKFLYIFTLFFYSCITLPTSQTPQIVPKDDLSFGASLSNSWIIIDDSLKSFPVPTPSFQGRYGISNKSDVGFLFIGLPILGLTCIDYRYQFWDNIMLGTSNMGIGFWALDGILISPFFGINFGNEVLYMGSRIHYYLSYYWERRVFNHISITPFIGLTLGKDDFKLVTELNSGIPISIMQRTHKNTSLDPLFMHIFTYSIGVIYLPKKKRYSF